jgi:two-component system cell cycle response regulator
MAETKNVVPGRGGTPRPRQTTEVHLAAGEGDRQLERAQTPEPALILMEGDLPGQVFRLRAGRQVVGRRPECDIRVRERAVSGVHAEVVRNEGIVTINDLASTNGTFVNGARIERPVALAQGHLVKLGNCVLRYVDSLLEVEFTEALHARGITDQLTGAWNHGYLMSRLRFVLDTASETRPVSVIAFDFDDFKQINDRYGHAAGDEALRSASALILDTIVRATDAFARMGGEEFAILLPETTLAEATAIAESVRVALESHRFAYEGLEIRLTSSFGVCTSTDPTEPAEVLLARADGLLYRSKHEGRNRVTAE